MPLAAACSDGRTLQSSNPAGYLHATTVEERKAHLSLYTTYHERIEQPGGRVQFSWSSHTSKQLDKPSVVLFAVFLDSAGLLGVIASVLSEHNVDIRNLSAFSTVHGIAVDTFELSANFSQRVATALRARLILQIDQQAEASSSIPMAAMLKEMPEHYVGSTTQVTRSWQPRCISLLRLVLVSHCIS